MVLLRLLCGDMLAMSSMGCYYVHSGNKMETFDVYYLSRWLAVCRVPSICLNCELFCLSHCYPEWVFKNSLSSFAKITKQRIDEAAIPTAWYFFFASHNQWRNMKDHPTTTGPHEDLLLAVNQWQYSSIITSPALTPRQHGQNSAL